MATNLNAQRDKLEEQRLGLLQELKTARSNLPLPVSITGSDTTPLMSTDEQTSEKFELVEQLEARIHAIEAEIERTLSTE